jgi:hypothetical protein
MVRAKVMESLVCKLSIAVNADTLFELVYPMVQDQSRIVRIAALACLKKISQQTKDEKTLGQINLIDFKELDHEESGNDEWKDWLEWRDVLGMLEGDGDDVHGLVCYDC